LSFSLSLWTPAEKETDEGPPVVKEEEIRAELGPLFDILRIA